MDAPRIPPYTVDDLVRFSENQNLELIRGELRELPLPSGAIHGETTALFSAHTMRYVIEMGLGIGFAANTGFLLSRDPDTVKAPDFAFVSTERLAGVERGTGYLAAVPDLVLETRSPSDRSLKVAEKITEWLEAGTRMAIDLDPMKRTLTIHQPGSEPMILTAAETFTGGDVLPGFSLSLSRVFRQR